MWPTCPICCETLGEHGGPTTLPCGHNGCLECMQAVQQRQAECPLCRTNFDRSARLNLNTELRDLIAAATQQLVDATDRASGWEALPSSEMTTKHYSAELMKRVVDDPVPSAPPLEEDGDLESLNPPQWVADSSSETCMGCMKPFLPILRLRHHCRLCGRLFCHSCSEQRLLLPPKFSQRDLQRVCEMCARVLKPYQGRFYDLYQTTEMFPVQDSFDWCSLRSWINNPFSPDMEGDIYKATNVLMTFHKLLLMFPGVVSETFLASIQGAVVLSQVKVGFGVCSCRLGTGLMISRVGDGRQWSRPCSLSSATFGAGLQIGGQLMDVVILLPDAVSVEALAGDRQVALSGGASASLGVGPGFHRLFYLGVGGGEGFGVGQGYAFCLCRGAFVGASLDGTLLSVRHVVNDAFYGRRFTAEELLLDSVPPPRAATHLLDQMDQLFNPHDVRPPPYPSRLCNL